MSEEKFIRVTQLCQQYQVETTWFSELNDLGIIEIQTIEDAHYIQEEHLGLVERVVRLQKELHINLEGIDTVLNLLDKIEDLQMELTAVKNRLRLYEDEV